MRPSDWSGKRRWKRGNGPSCSRSSPRSTPTTRGRAPLTRQFFTERLQKRVELFQTTQNILPNGVINAQTLRRLNEVLGADKLLVELDEQKLLAPLETEGL